MNPRKRKRGGGEAPLAEEVKAKVMFGDWNSLFLGLDKLHNLTTGTPTRYEVRVDLQTANESAYAVYDFFQVASSKERYRLTVGKYSGTAGARMT